MRDSASIRAAVTRRYHPPQPGTIRLWTMQPLYVWSALQTEKFLLVDPHHPEFADSLDCYRDSYDWMRAQMAQRIPGYTGHYPWWAYDHFLDLRFYRWHTWPFGQRLVRLELAVPREQVLLSAYGAWHCVLNRGYLPETVIWEEYERELDDWLAAAAHDGVDAYRHNPLAEPWETRMKASWERIFDVEMRRPTETIQATFERLELKHVVKATEFESMPERR